MIRPFERPLWMPFLLALLFISLAACSSNTAPSGSTATTNASTGDRLQVVATTTILGDVVANVGGDAIDLSVLLPVGADPHSFEPTPQDAALVSQADLIFINGAGLEEFMTPLLENTGSQVRLVSVSDGIKLIQPAAGDEHAGETQTGDPHVWFDPTNVEVWVDNIAAVLSEMDPQNAALYAQNAADYRQKLADLDAWIQQQVQAVPPANRELVTDHTIFEYFARRYGFEQLGTLIPGYSTNTQPSAQQLAALIDKINSLHTPAVFVGDTVNPTLAEQISQDTGTQLVQVYTGSLTGPDGPASTYLDFMRYDVQAIVEALK